MTYLGRLRWSIMGTLVFMVSYFHQQRPAGDSPILTRIWTPTRASVVPPTGAHPFYDPLRVNTLTKANPVACFLADIAAAPAKDGVAAQAVYERAI